MSEVLYSYLEKYSMSDLVNGYKDVQSDSHVKIGFLGEFSSGKSSLINAMLSRDVLPYMDTPTSKSIVHVVADKNVDDIKYYLLSDNDREEINMSTFQNYALGHEQGLVEVRCKPNELLKDSFFIVDTPGLSSISQTDTDITYGYLPRLDGAVICIDTSRGAINQSLIEFLQQEMVNQLSKYFIFALTKADLKSEADAEQIRTGLIKTLTEQRGKISLLDPVKQTVLVSTKSGVNDALKITGNFAKAYQEIIVDQSKAIRANRTKIEFNKIKDELISRLTELHNTMELSLPDISAKLDEYKTTMAGIESEKLEARRINADAANEIGNAIQKIVYSYKESFLALNRENFSEIIDALKEEISQKVTSVISKYYGNLDSSVNVNTCNLTSRIIKIMENTDLVSRIFSIVLLTAPIKTVAGSLAKGVKSLAKLGPFLEPIAKVIDIPEFVIGRFKNSALKKATDNEMGQLMSDISLQIQDMLDTFLHQAVSEMEGRYKEMQTTTDRLFKDKEKSEIECSAKQRVLMNDIKTLKENK